MTIWHRFPDGAERNQLRDRVLMRVDPRTQWPDTIPLTARLTLVTMAAIFSYEQFKKFESFETELYKWELDGTLWALRCMNQFSKAALDYQWAINQLHPMAGYIDQLPDLYFHPRLPVASYNYGQAQSA